jgi:nitrite reductase/ring-hydroxylating ferredoxin subunit
MAEYLFGNADDIKDREPVVKLVANREIGVFRLGPELYAWENNCPHMGGPVCQGRVINRVDEVIDAEGKSQGYKYVDEDVHIVCPWHGYEFNIRTGKHPGDRQALLNGYDVTVKDGSVYVEID